MNRHLTLFIIKEYAKLGIAASIWMAWWLST